MSTGFHLACHSSGSLASFIIDNSEKLNIDINAKDESGWTGFHIACKYGNYPSLVSLMLNKSKELNIDINAKVEDNQIMSQMNAFHKGLVPYGLTLEWCVEDLLNRTKDVSIPPNEKNDANVEILPPSKNNVPNVTILPPNKKDGPNVEILPPNKKNGPNIELLPPDENYQAFSTEEDDEANADILTTNDFQNETKNEKLQEKLPRDDNYVANGKTTKASATNVPQSKQNSSTDSNSVPSTRSKKYIQKQVKKRGTSTGRKASAATTEKAIKTTKAKTIFAKVKTKEKRITQSKFKRGAIKYIVK